MSPQGERKCLPPSPFALWEFDKLDIVLGNKPLQLFHIRSLWSRNGVCLCHIFLLTDVFLARMFLYCLHLSQSDETCERIVHAGNQHAWMKGKRLRRSTSSGGSVITLPMAQAASSRFACVRDTKPGASVVPLISKETATSSGAIFCPVCTQEFGYSPSRLSKA